VEEVVSLLQEKKKAKAFCRSLKARKRNESKQIITK